MSRPGPRLRSLHAPLVLVVLVATALPACSRVKALLGRGDEDDAGLVDAGEAPLAELDAAPAEAVDAGVAPALPVDPADDAAVVPVTPVPGTTPKPRDASAPVDAAAALGTDAGFVLPRLDAAVPTLPGFPLGFDAGALRDRLRDSGLPRFLPR